MSAATAGRRHGARLDRRVRDALLAASAALLALWIATRSGVHHTPVSGLLDTLQAAARAVGAALLLFVVCGFGLTRLVLPPGLRRYEALWIVALGATVLSLAMTVLCFAYVPFKAALALTVLGGLALAAVAVRRGGGALPALRPAGWPVLVAVLLTAVALVPYFVEGFPTVTGSGSDAFHAVGAAEFLQHNYPTSVNPAGPLDQMPPLWTSKQPIYYALGSVASLAGLEPYQTLAPLAALMAALAAAGIFLVVRELLGGSVAAGVVAMAVTGLDAMVLHVPLNPYFNQTWGYFAFPFSLVLAWWAVRRRSGGAALLLVLFLLLEAFAYPLALPLPALALVVFFSLDARERRRRGERVLPRRLPSGRRGAAALAALALAAGVALAVPLHGALEKMSSAARLLFDPNSSLKDWAGDVFHFIPGYKFFALPGPTLWWLLVGAMALLAFWALSRMERPLAWGIGAVLVVFLAAGIWFRQRHYGQYFEFKALTFAAPLLIACTVVALSRLGRVGVVLMAAFVLSAVVAGQGEAGSRRAQLSRPFLQLRDWARDLPTNASVRLDTWPPNQLWGSYFLSRQRLCSLMPLVGTQYPSVAYARRAQFVLVDDIGERYLKGRRPLDAVGAPIQVNQLFKLYRAIPRGRGGCSRRLFYIPH
jgi:hypothetical protein